MSPTKAEENLRYAKLPDLFCSVIIHINTLELTVKRSEIDLFTPEFVVVSPFHFTPAKPMDRYHFLMNPAKYCSVESLMSSSVRLKVKPHRIIFPSKTPLTNLEAPIPQTAGLLHTWGKHFDSRFLRRSG